MSDEEDLSAPATLGSVRELSRSVRELREEVKKSKPKGPWDKAAILLGALTPILIAGGTLWISATLRQIERENQDARESHLRDRELQVEVAQLLSTLIDDLVQGDHVAKELAKTALAIADPTRAARVATALEAGEALSASVLESIVTLRVTLIKIEVKGDCDQWTDGDGDFFYSFSVNGQTIAAVPRSSTVQAKEERDIEVNLSTLITLLEEPSSKITIEGMIADKDRFTSGDDDVLGLIRTDVLLADKPWEQDSHPIKFFKDAGCHAVAWYRVERVHLSGNVEAAAGD